MNGYIEERNGNKYLMLDSTDESKETRESMKNCGTKLVIMMRNIYKSNLIQMSIYNIVTLVRSVFHEDNKYYPQVFQD